MMEELISYGAQVVVRLGSNDFNVTKDDLNSLYVVRACYGLVGMFQDLGYPPEVWGRGIQSDDGLVVSLLSRGRQLDDVQVWDSLGYNVESFYAFMNPEIAYDPIRVGKMIDRYQKELDRDGGRICRDMETCAVLLISELRGIRAASVLQAVIKHDESSHEDVGTTGIHLVLETLVEENRKLVKYQ